ncbi:sigma-70 family RNA polymerase sigma factor [Promicromonospora sukumoe]|uniref:sigma-70 family RNA polymerase sigma factor n=1 Tax=Promicromonospora sukumoe TaxID=88382 RepID=UPI00037FBFDC|nr:sigma-70 family RNA polymerase sigma factor [Promicromonospora sukumoe]
MSMSHPEPAAPTDPGTGRVRELDLELERELDHDRRLDVGLDVFLAQRTRLIQIARRVTGDFAGAEDVVQDAWLRWQRADRDAIRNPAAFLTTTTTRLAINVIQSARHRHEATGAVSLAKLADLTGPADRPEDPVLRAEQTALLERTLQVLMARLSPDQLAAYLLRKCFDYPYGEIARRMNTSSANVRQMVRRAQQGIEGGRERPVARGDHRRLVRAFQTAARTGDLAVLEGMLVRAARRSTPQRGQRARGPLPARAA